jgi:hypothetical protein
VVEKLNPQELRHSQYFGEFVTAVEKLAEDPFWDDLELFSRRDSQRMKDIEFISELHPLKNFRPKQMKFLLLNLQSDFHSIKLMHNLLISRLPCGITSAIAALGRGQN